MRCDELAEVAEGLHRGEVVGLQDELGFEVLHAVERRSIGVYGRIGCRSRARSGVDSGFLHLVLLAVLLLFTFRHNPPRNALPLTVAAQKLIRVPMTLRPQSWYAQLSNLLVSTLEV